VSGSDPVEQTPALKVYYVSVVVACALVLGWTLAPHPDLLHPSLLFWMAALAVVALMPVQVWGGVQLSLDLPIHLAVAILYPPSVAALIALVGEFDNRELNRTMPPLKGLFLRCQIALAVYLSGLAFHAMASLASPWWVISGAALVAAVTNYSANTLLVAWAIKLERGRRLMEVIGLLHGDVPWEFVPMYVGLGLLGVVLARVYLDEGWWAVAVFFAPVLVARQLYFRTRSLSQRLSEQNTVLAQQAKRLQDLLDREHLTVEELRQLNRMKEEFVAVASHELRSPLTSIIGFAKTLGQPEFGDDPVMRREFLQAMERQGDRLLSLVENLLTASRVEREGLSISLDPVDISDLCREVVEGLGPAGARVTIRLGSDLPVVETDRTLLGQVLTNLLDNALKYSSEPTPCEIGAQMIGDTLAVSVADRGIGISPEELDRIFERFYQVDSSASRAFRGVGLGLSLVADLVKALDGRVDVKSEPGRGSVFTVRLPLRHPAEGRLKVVRAAC
jgi:signal transduction histidine kinase